MTTSPVPSINDELLAELEQKAKAAVSSKPDTDRPSHEHAINMDRHYTAANPATILALVEHIRSLSERLEKAEKDAGRYRYFRDAGLPNGLGLYDDELDAEIDLQISEVAAIAQEADHE